MKKEYVNPTVNILELEYNGMLCTSDPESSKISTFEPEEIGVSNEPYDGEVL